MEANEWAARQKSAQGELGAIAKAKEILEQGVKVLLQVTAKTTSTDEQDRRAKVLRSCRAAALCVCHALGCLVGRSVLLGCCGVVEVADLVRGLATKDHSFALSQLAAAAASDPFGKVRGTRVLLSPGEGRLSGAAEVLAKSRARNRRAGSARWAFVRRCAG